jgi:hypothetical protein
MIVFSAMVWIRVAAVVAASTLAIHVLDQTVTVIVQRLAMKPAMLARQTILIVLFVTMALSAMVRIRALAAVAILMPAILAQGLMEMATAWKLVENLKRIALETILMELSVMIATFAPERMTAALERAQVTQYLTVAEQARIVRATNFAQ